MARIIKQGKVGKKHFCELPGGSKFLPSLSLGSIWECDCARRYKVKVVTSGHRAEFWRRTCSPRWLNIIRRWVDDGPTQKD